MMELHIDSHPLLSVRAFKTVLPRALGELSTPAAILALHSLDSPAPMSSSDALRSAVRDALRWGGFKPTGRSKPASEYLLKAAREGLLSSINLVVDICNAVSLHSGFPISVVDADRLTLPLRVAIAEPGATYVFNASGQTMEVGGLACLHDGDGPCANAVKDAQRTKTHGETRQTLSIVWGAAGLTDALDKAVAWYRDLVQQYGAATEDVVLR